MSVSPLFSRHLWRFFIDSSRFSWKVLVEQPTLLLFVGAFEPYPTRNDPGQLNQGSRTHDQHKVDEPAYITPDNRDRQEEKEQGH
jgi:hypothetical protein